MLASWSEVGSLPTLRAALACARLVKLSWAASTSLSLMTGSCEMLAMIFLVSVVKEEKEDSGIKCPGQCLVRQVGGGAHDAGRIANGSDAGAAVAGTRS